MSVHLLDLRGTTAREALQRVRRDFGEGAPLTGSDRALVLDGTELLLDHGPAYVEAFTGGRVRSLVCVVCGSPSDDGSGRRVLERPGELGPERGVATLWVSHETGVDWGLLPPGTPRPHPDAAPGSRAGVAHLVEVLSQAEVFDQIVELSRRMPDAAASPGLSWAGPEGGSDAVASALARAVRDFTDPDRGGPGPSAESAPGPRGGILADLVRGTHRPTPGDGHPGTGELAGHERRLRDDVADAEAALAAASGWGGVLAAPVRIREAELARVGGSLSGYRERVRSLLSRLSSLGGERLAAELERAGLRGRPPGPEDVEEAVGALARRAEERLSRGSSVTGVAADLDRVAERVSPRGSAAALPRADRAAPDEVIAALSSPPPFPLPRTLSGLLPAAFLLPLLPALTGGWAGPVGALVLALGWVGALAAGLRSARGPGAGRPLLAVHAVTAFAGALAGTGLGGLLRTDSLPPGPPPPLLLGAALAVSAAAGTVVLVRTWTGLARRWRDQVGLARAGAAASALTSLVNETAREEWYPGPQRRRLADTARAAASAARAVADALSESVPGPGAPSRLPELEAVLYSDLAALARTCLEDLWARPRADGPVRDPYERTRATAADLMEEYRGHLDRVGPHAPPRFADPDLPRRIYGGSGLDRAVRTLLRQPEERMLQLCDPVHLPLLRDTASAVAVVRFAPRSLRGQLHHDGHGERAPEIAQGTVWTHGGRLTGLVRLVPLRHGVVRTRWSGAREPDPGSDPAGGSAEAPTGHDGPAVHPEGADGPAGTGPAAAQEGTGSRADAGPGGQDTEEATGVGGADAPPSPFEEDYLR
ncbi:MULTISPECIES: hypothetical protein [unclassified Nocardiopsis]|uniref:hypothetical protein n=1 Tax=unclassified Nocardiopsis TaxID=2649073 RepID=UPI00135B7BE7|nr:MULTISPECIES: hypothetical protein [unclassified Nocardiopsis]